MDPRSARTQEFRYILSFQPKFLMATLLGDLSVEASLSMEACRKDCLASGLKSIILQFRDVGGVLEAPTSQTIKRFLEDASKARIRVFFVGVHPELKSKISQVVPDELAPSFQNNLGEAIQILASDFPRSKMKKSA